MLYKDKFCLTSFYPAKHGFEKPSLALLIKTLFLLAKGKKQAKLIFLAFANKNKVFISKATGLVNKKILFFYRLVQQHKAYKNCTKYKLVYKFVLTNLINLCAILIFLVTITDVSFLYTFTIYTKYDKYKF